MAMKKWRGKRGLLNLPGHHLTAAVVAEIEDTRAWKDGCDRNGEPLEEYSIAPETVVAITDCYRTINLECEFHTPEARRNSLHKLDTLIAALTAFREALADEQGRYVERERARPRVRKSKDNGNGVMPWAEIRR